MLRRNHASLQVVTKARVLSLSPNSRFAYEKNARFVRTSFQIYLRMCVLKQNSPMTNKWLRIWHWNQKILLLSNTMQTWSSYARRLFDMCDIRDDVSLGIFNRRYAFECTMKYITIQCVDANNKYVINIFFFCHRQSQFSHSFFYSFIADLLKYISVEIH